MKFLKVAGLALGASMLAAAAAGAQPINITPTGASGWWVQCEQIAFPLDANPCTTSGFQSAVVVNPLAAGWETEAPHFGAHWISVQQDASISPNIVGEAANYKYTFRTFLDVTTAGNYDIFLTDLHLDNYFFDVYVNGSAVGMNVTPTPLDPEGGNWTTEFSATGSSYFGEGSNTFDIVITGNGRTDGLLASGYIIGEAGGTVVPEPGSFILLASGLGLLGLAANRRRKS